MTTRFTRRPLPGAARASLVGGALIGVALLTGPAAAQPLDQARIRQIIDSLAMAELRDGPTAGMSIAAWRRGELLFTGAWGMADIEHGDRARLETVYKVGSVSKQFTSVALLQLVDQGRVRLDADIREYLPDAPTGGRRVTVTQILDHTSGIPSYTALGPAFGRDSFRLDADPARIAGWLANRPFDFDPGTDWRYNNSGFLLAGMIVERVSGESFAEYVRRHIAEPLGLTATGYCDERGIVPHRATGYLRARNGFINGVGETMAIPFSAGAICSTVLDLVRFRAALGTGRLISQSSYQRMITPAVLANGWRTNYGFGLARYHVGPVEVIRHGGSITGFQANLAYLPGEDVIIAALANTSGSDPVGVSDRIVQLLTGQTVRGPTPQTLPPERAARLAGRWRLGPLEMVVAARGSDLTIGPPGGPPARLVWQGGTGFLAQPAFAFGFYGGEVSLTIPIDGPAINGFTLHHPLGGTVEAVRIGR